MAEIDVLVVDPLHRQRGRIAFQLRAAGYQVDVAGSFEQARQKIEVCPPQCIVTSVKLGMYNGLHLIARSKSMRSTLASVLTYDVADPVLECEARSHQSEFVVLPCSADVLVTAVRQSIDTARKSTDLSFSQMKVSPQEEFEAVVVSASTVKH